MGANDHTPGGAGTPTPDERPEEPHVGRMRAQEEFEFAPDGQVVTDGHGLIQNANHAAAALLRCPKEFLAGKPLGLFVTEGHRPRFYECLSRLWRGTGSDAFETRVARRREPPRDVAVRVHVADGWRESRSTTSFRWVLRDVTVLKRAEEARAELLRRLVSAQEDERRRVSRELHDTFGQLLTALTLSAKAARDAAPLPAATDARLAEVQRLADELGRVAHDLAVRLRPTALDDVGLFAALGQWAARAGVEADYEASAVEAERLPRDVETAVYRVVQEALTNVARHAGARRVSVVISRHGESVTAAVEDDGVGFDADAAAGSGRLGLVGMRERAAQADGTLDVESSPGGGTTVLARFPLRNGGGGGGAD